MSVRHTIAFWNLENLFDVADSPRRSDKLRRVLGKAVRGWDESRLSRKLEQLARVIRALNDQRGPDLLGVCEVENRHVLERLAAQLAPLGRRYDIAHADTRDQRGIDVAFLYDRDRFTAEAQFSHWVMRRTATRDLFQVNFRTAGGRPLVVVGNHWPARLPDAAETAGYRAIAGETLAYFHQRIREELGRDTPVLAMGDFNDEPFAASLTRHALARRSRARVSNARSPVFLNLMWPLLGRGEGTLYHHHAPFLFDQFLANQALLKQRAPLRALPETAAIFRLPAMTRPGDYPEPIRFGGLGKTVNRDGFSDHFPIIMELGEKD
jgi:endonuclease/exonuclease/phosphatase family metal-dependent hydrolase